MNTVDKVTVVKDNEEGITQKDLDKLLEVPAGAPSTKVGITRKDKSVGKTKRNKTAKKSRKINRKIAKKNTRRRTGSKKRK